MNFAQCGTVKNVASGFIKASRSILSDTNKMIRTRRYFDVPMTTNVWPESSAQRRRFSIRESHISSRLLAALETLPGSSRLRDPHVMQK